MSCHTKLQLTCSPIPKVEYDVGRRTGPGFIPLTPITKTVWTVAVEAVSEYCRY